MQTQCTHIRAGNQTHSSGGAQMCPLISTKSWYSIIYEHNQLWGGNTSRHLDVDNFSAVVCPKVFNFSYTMICEQFY